MAHLQNYERDGQPTKTTKRKPKRKHKKRHQVIMYNVLPHLHGFWDDDVGCPVDVVVGDLLGGEDTAFVPTLGGGSCKGGGGGKGSM